MTDQLRRNGSLVEMLGGALRDAGHGWTAAPALLRQVLTEGSWREMVTQRGEHVNHERIEEFVTAQPLSGLGATVDLVERLIGTDDPDLLRLWRSARKGRPGRPRKGTEKAVDSTKISGAERSDLTAERLARDAPDEYEAVRRGEKKLNAAARDAGIRRYRVSVYMDDAVSAARALRKHMAPDQIAELARLLLEGA